ncbi:MAG: hypothetical protein LBG92_11310, partial [Prevotellaceae bacterium]|nr:hypothetical protein [Prevotellaceae bacterium]
PTATERQKADGFGRFGVRRGYIRIGFENKFMQAVFLPNITSSGIKFQWAYAQVKDPWKGVIALKAGVFDRPFGYENAYSSAARESPERARFIQKLFPGVADVGATLILQLPKTSPLNIFKLEAGVLSGNAINPDFDSRMDFIGRLSVNKTFGNFQIGAGVSAYMGGVLQRDSSVFEVKNGDFALLSKSADNIGKYAERNYFGADIQATLQWEAGKTHIRGEFVTGRQANNQNGNYTYNYSTAAAALEAAGPVYMRNLSGGYALLSQTFGKLPLTFIVKYDIYDPNSDLSGNQVKKAGDISIQTVGAGLFWDIVPQLRLLGYGEFVKTEISENLAGYEKSRRSNAFTLRLQYKF